MENTTSSNRIQQQGVSFLMQVESDFGSLSAAKQQLTALLVNLNIQDDQDSITAQERKALALVIDAFNEIA